MTLIGFTSLAFLSLSGCVAAFYTYKSVDLKVLDRQTMSPAVGRHVSLTYRYVLVYNTPESDKGITDKNGVVRLRYGTWGAGTIDVQNDEAIGGSELMVANQDELRHGGTLQPTKHYSLILSVPSAAAH